MNNSLLLINSKLIAEISAEFFTNFLVLNFFTSIKLGIARLMLK
jgi:hypothetical protein